MVTAIRRTPISAGDIFSIKSAMLVAENYSVRFDKQFIITIGAGCLLFAMAAVILYCYLWEGDRREPSNRNITGKMRLSIIAGNIIISYILIATSFLGDITGSVADYFTHESNGFAWNLYLQLKDIEIKEPENYEKYLEEALKVAESDSVKEDEYPNIIVVMNESFADLSVFGDFKTNQEVFPTWNGLEENTIKGNLYMSVYGGGTANSEYEFLTGSSVQYFSERLMAFQLYMNEERPSIFSQMDALGYETAFMHPHKASSYNRPGVYANLGVDSMMFDEDMRELELYGNFASDESQYAYVMKYLENPKRDKPLFLFDVTVQNHGGYTNPVEGLEQITINGHEGEFKETENYLALAQESDRALGEFLKKLESYEEPTAVLFFGDHQPAIETGFIETMMGKSMKDFTLEDRQKMYCTPFLLWANYDIESGYVERMSANYLGAFLCDELGIPMTGFQKFQLQMKKEMPIVNTAGIMDKDGNYLNVDELQGKQEQWLKEYYALIYHYMFDENSDQKTFYRLAQYN